MKKTRDAVAHWPLIKLKGLVYVLVLVLLSSYVLGFDALSSFGPAEIYEQYNYWIDFFISFFIFLGISMAVFGDKFKGGSKMIIFGISFVLSMSLVYWEIQNDLSLMSFGPVAMLLLFALVYLIFYYVIDKLEKPKVAAIGLGFAITYLLFFKLLNWVPFTMNPGIEEVLTALFWIGLIAGGIAWFFEKK